MFKKYLRSSPWYKSLFASIGLTIAISLIALVVTQAIADSATPNPGEQVSNTYVPPGETIPPTPTSPPRPTVNYEATPGPSQSPEERDREREELLKNVGINSLDEFEQLKEKGSSFGPGTAGSTILIAETEIQLPEDAYIVGRLDRALCIVGMHCPPLPIYTIARGNSTISLSAPSGEVTAEDTIVGEEHLFDFLDSVRKPTKARDLNNLDPETITYLP